MKKLLRDVYGETLVELGAKEKNIVVVDSDLASSTKTILFQRAYPDRHFNLGVAENNMLLFAAGLAIAGKTVFASSFAVFETGRAWEIIRNTIAHDKLNVKLVASHAGISVGEDGYSHQANEDIAIMRAIPNMQVFCPADPYETKKIIEYCASFKGPAYVRLSREAFPYFLEESISFQAGKSFILKEGNHLSVLATGAMVYPALQAAFTLEEENIFVRVVNVSSIKPLDEELILDCAKKTQGIITCEEHSVIGGLGSAVSELLAEKYPVKVLKIGIPDTFGQSGKAEELFKFYGLTAEDIKLKIKNFFNT